VLSCWHISTREPLGVWLANNFINRYKYRYKYRKPNKNAHMSIMKTYLQKTRRYTRRQWRKAGVKAGTSAVIITLGSALLMFMLESRSNQLYSTPWDSLWWSLVTMTTTGYGDVVPKSFIGRSLGVFVMFSGMALVSFVTALAASTFVTESLKEARGLEVVREKGHIILAGWNWGAERVIQGLSALRGGDDLSIVMINQLPEDAVNEVLHKHRDLQIKFVRGDFTNETVLERANVRAATAAIILADSMSPSGARADERTVLACLALKHLNPDIKVTGELLDAENEAHLLSAHADHAVVSGEFNAFLLSTAVLSPGVSLAIRSILSHDSGHQLREEPIPGQLIGKTFAELALYLRQEQRILVLGLVTERQGLTLTDVLSADYTSVDEFIRRKFEEAGIGFGGLQQTILRVNPEDNYVVASGDKVLVIGYEGQ